MQPIHTIPHQLQLLAEAVKSYFSDEAQQHHFVIRLRLNQQLCIGKGVSEVEARIDAVERAVTYLRGAGQWKDEEPKVSLMSFGVALENLKAGQRIARKGWNGANQWLSVSCSGTREVPAQGFWSPHNAKYAEENGGFAKVAPCITLKNAQGEIVMGWIPSTGDLFANDWVIL